mmetsp:Transcript_30549/g.57844  ORF Transcript_30549/g.57844 Transcript_30549/m.57844 type:complete len:532 (+) Transcript_30549:182-1777(+)|eukprot:CAMPEP_0201667674 /NCGR_PEP_ID=MMETSP0494-20130426/16180_1 /ASSEMBLY_ACC=CAM_ASM_000839 /TAXON_ID=420259 /ORGANISM="Thalassiosira gravida, Strain GMp14c1" /LENGTH=531 /DNA_ID=CAMNT_0048147755 /DNA_START=193 /DNA_END=1788 /DNA_ORIENTATION=-
MWAAFKSDLQEFASGAAEETTAVASKVGVHISSDDGDASGRSSGGGVGSGLSGFASSTSQRGSGTDGSVLFANAAFSIGEKGLKGFQGMSSMVGGIVAPASATAVGGATNNSSSALSSFASSGGNNKPSAALSSMMLAEDEDEEEDEFGWDDDDDDLDVDIEEEGGEDNKSATGVAGQTDFFEEHLGSTEKGENKSIQPSVDAVSSASPTSSSLDKEVLTALQSKLDTVEKARAELQIEHRSQTAELVELRAKVEELEQQRDINSGIDGAAVLSEGGSGKSEEEVQALEVEVERLRVLLDEQQPKDDLPQEHKDVVEALIQEKVTLDKELNDQKQQNDQLSQENLNLQEQIGQMSQDKVAASGKEQGLIQQYGNKIKDLTEELQSLQVNLDTKEQSFLKMEESYALALKDAQESKTRLAELDNEVRDVMTKLEARDVIPEVRPGEEKERVSEAFEFKLAKMVGSSADSPSSAVEEVLAVAEPSAGQNQDVTSETANNDDSDDDADEESTTPVKSDGNGDEELSDDWGDGEW